MFEYFITTYGGKLIGLMLCIIFGMLGRAVKQIYIQHVNDDTKRTIAKVVVQFVEQAWKTLHGKDKLQKALETAEALLKKKGIDFDADEMKVLIEAAVAEFNEVFKAPLNAENSAKATHRVPEASADVAE